MQSAMREEAKNTASGSPVSAQITVKTVSDLIISSISSSFSIRCFTGKWQLIRDKLEQLLSGLTEASVTNFSNENSELNSFLKSVNSTLDDLNVMLERCGDEAYNGGKLLMRSDLGAMASRLDMQNKKLSGIYASGILMDSKAIVLSKPGASAGRDEIRFYVKDLFSRIKIGNTNVRSQALDKLDEILREDDKYVRIVALENVDGIGLLVSFLELGDDSIQERAAGVVSVIVEFDTLRGVLVNAGIIAPLIQLLEKGSELSKEKAARALRKLTENCDNVWSISAQGGVSMLLKICSDGDSNAELISSACSILRNLSSVEEIKRYMIEKGVVSILIKLSRSQHEECQIQAIEFLRAMASEDDSISHKIVREGIVMSLIEILNPSLQYSLKAREIALRATEFFCFPSTNLLNVLMSCNFLNYLLVYLKSGDISIQELTLKTISNLCQISEEYKKAMGDMGFLSELIRSLEAKSFEVRETSSEVLCSMITVQRNRRSLIHDDHSVNQIMQLLNPDEGKLASKKLLLCVLSVIADSNSGRRKIMTSDHLQYLEKLALDNVPEAKKVLKKLSVNRFRSILNGIWSY